MFEAKWMRVLFYVVVWFSLSALSFIFLPDVAAIFVLSAGWFWAMWNIYREVKRKTQ